MIVLKKCRLQVCHIAYYMHPTETKDGSVSQEIHRAPKLPKIRPECIA